MNGHASLRTGAACALAAILAAGCATVELATPVISDAPTPTSPTTPVAPTPSPSPTAAPPDPTPAPTPTSVPVSGEVVMARFVDFLVEEPDFHLVCTANATINVGGETESLLIVMDGGISDQNFDGYLSIQSAGTTIEADVVVIGDVGYVRPARGDWQPGEQFNQTQPLNPFTSELADDFSYVGPTTIDGRAFHDLYTETWVGGNIKKVGKEARLKKPRLEYSFFHIYVGDDGLPVTSLLEFAISGRYFGLPALFEYSVIYDFSQIGEPVTIVAPI